MNNAKSMTRNVEKPFVDYSAEEIRAAFIEAHGSDKPTEQIMSICDAVFDLIDNNESDIPPHLIKAFWHLQQSFRVYMSLVVNHPDKVVLMSSGSIDMDQREDSLDIDPEIPDNAD